MAPSSIFDRFLNKLCSSPTNTWPAFALKMTIYGPENESSRCTWKFILPKVTFQNVINYFFFFFLSLSPLKTRSNFFNLLWLWWMGSSLLFVYLVYPFSLVFCHNCKQWNEVLTTWNVSVFGVFLVLIFPHSDWIRRDTLYLSVFSPNAGKYGPEKFRIRTLFTRQLLNYT